MRALRWLAPVMALVFLLVANGQEALGKSQFFKNGEFDAIAEKGLEYLAYNPQGAAGDGKAVYILAGAMCPYTQQVMQAKDALQALQDKGIQIRWVFPKSNTYNPAPVLYLVNSPLPEAFNDFFRRIGREPTPEQEVISGLNNVVGNASENLAGFPSISYKTAKGVKYTHSINDVLEDADQIVPVNDKSSKTLEYAREILAKDLGEPVQVKNTSKKTMVSYALPDTDSPKLDGAGRFRLKPGQSCQDTCYDYNNEFYLCKFVYEGEENSYFYSKH